MLHLVSLQIVNEKKTTTLRFQYNENSEVKQMLKTSIYVKYHDNQIIV